MVRVRINILLNYGYQLDQDFDLKSHLEKHIPCLHVERIQGPENETGPLVHAVEEFIGMAFLKVLSTAF